jgi:hypothetical protein
MRLLFAIPHYFDPSAGGAHGSLGGDAGDRAQLLENCIAGLHQHFGRPQCEIDIARRTTVPTNLATAVTLDVVVCTTGSAHLLHRLSLGPAYFTQQSTAAEPRLLGFECHAALRDRLGAHDYYCYLEDDLLIRDPWFFVKLRWFTSQFGDDALLLPNRYEIAINQIVHKAYIDGPLRSEIAGPFQNIASHPRLEAETIGQRVAFRRTTNPHCGGFFLNQRQMRTWAACPHFLDRDVRFVGPLESAATLGVMRTFRVYKPAEENGAFLELEHPGDKYLSLIRMPKSEAHGDASPS